MIMFCLQFDVRGQLVVYKPCLHESASQMGYQTVCSNVYIV